MSGSSVDEAQGVLKADLVTAIAYIPRIAGALVIVLVGAVFAWIIGRIVGGILSRVGLDALSERTGLLNDLSRMGIRSRPSALLGRLAFIIVLVAASTQAIDTLEFAPISAALRLLLAYAPHVILAVLLLLLGVIAADIVAGGASRAMSRAGVLYHGPTATILRTTIIALAALMALKQLTIESAFLFDVLLVALGAAALAAGLSAGWGARTFAENLIAARYVERHVKPGDSIDVQGIAGIVETLDTASVVVRTEDGQRVLLPNAVLSQNAVRILPTTNRTASSEQPPAV